MAPTLGGVHKIQILIRDLLKEFLEQIFGEEMGGSGGPRPPYVKTPSWCRDMTKQSEQFKTTVDGTKFASENSYKNEYNKF